MSVTRLVFSRLIANTGDRVVISTSILGLCQLVQHLTRCHHITDPALALKIEYIS